MRKIYIWYRSLSNQFRDSVYFSGTFVGLISSILSTTGISLGNWNGSNIWMRIIVVLGVWIFIFLAIYFLIGKIFKEKIKIIIHQTPIYIGRGDIFSEEGLKVIGCDNHFDSRVDDVVISKKSLQGQLIMHHAKKEEIIKTIKNAAIRLNIGKDESGLYNFPLGTIVPYISSIDKQTYLLLSMTKLNSHHEAHTNMVEYEQMLMKMWKEISRVYAMNEVVIPLLGAGIQRFDDGPKEKESLLKCMLCTLNSSGISLKARIKIVLFDNTKDISLYEYKNLIK